MAELIKLDKATFDKQISKFSKNFREEFKDEIFITIKKNAELNKILNRITIIIQYLILFSYFFMFLAVISILFYPNKRALILFGLTSVLHNIFAPLAIISIRKQNRYLFFSFCLANLIWLSSVSFALFYYFFLANKNDITKIQFNNEISVHVGFSFYYPISFFASYYILILFHQLIQIKDIKASAQSQIGSQSSSKIN